MYSAREYQSILGMSIRQFAKTHNIPYETAIHPCKRGYCKIDKRMKGATQHPLYKCYRDMLTRCYNPSNKNYQRYGGRGIKVCPLWFYSFKDFVDDMEKDYHPGLSLDRIDNSKGYSKSNCRWTSAAVQTWNREKTNSLPGLKRLPSGKWLVSLKKDHRLYTSRVQSTIEQAVKVWLAFVVLLKKPIKHSEYETWLREAKKVRW